MFSKTYFSKFYSSWSNRIVSSLSTATCTKNKNKTSEKITLTVYFNLTNDEIRVSSHTKATDLTRFRSCKRYKGSYWVRESFK